MTGKTTIEWCSAVWNPTTGCTRVSVGCDNCYAFALHDKRYAANLRAVQRTGDPYDGMTFREWLEGGRFRSDHPETVGRKDGLSLAAQYDLPFSRVQRLPDRLDDPLRHRRPERYFVDSMADLWHADVPDEFIDKVFATMALAAHHTFLILTKRPERMRLYAERWRAGDTSTDILAADQQREGTGWKWPLTNVWLGASVEDQTSADERIPHLLATPAAVRFLSCEPLLGPVDLSRFLVCIVCGGRGTIPWSQMAAGASSSESVACPHCRQSTRRDNLDWVIVGGESGPHARPMDLAWMRSLMEQCRATGVPVFCKQLGSHVHDVAQNSIEQERFGRDDADLIRGEIRVKLRESHGRDIDEWPEDLRVREFPR